MTTFDQDLATKATEQLAELMDRVGLYDALGLMSDVCQEKADTLERAYDDPVGSILARNWRARASILKRASQALVDSWLPTEESPRND